MAKEREGEGAGREGQGKDGWGGKGHLPHGRLQTLAALGWGSGVSPCPGKSLKFEAQFGAIWCILARNCRFSSFPVSTFVNENIFIVLDSGIDVVTYYFKFLPRDAL